MLPQSLVQRAKSARWVPRAAAALHGIVGASLALGLGACSESGGVRVDARGTRLGAVSAASLARHQSGVEGRAPGTPALELLDTHETGLFKLGAAEIVDYHPGTRQAFVVNSRSARVAVLELGPRGFRRGESALEPGRDLEGFAAGQVTSLAVAGDLVAVAVCATSNDRRGRVAFYSASGLRFLGGVPVGYVPDMLTFTPDGRRVLVANEGEQLRNAAHQIVVDPEGSVSIIDLSRGVAQASVAHATFAVFDGRIEEYRVSGVRIPRLGDRFFDTGERDVRVSTDLEPEYIAVSSDGATAWVSLQENDAVAVLDVAAAKFTDILPLGVKDFSRGEPTFQTLTWPANASEGGLGEPRGLSFEAPGLANEPALFVLRGSAIERLVLAGDSARVSSRISLAAAAGGERRSYAGLAVDPRDHSFWLGDAERALIYHQASDGQPLRALAVGQRGALRVAAISVDPERRRLYAVLQGSAPGGGAGEPARLAHILAFDADAGSPRFGAPLGEWLYLLDGRGGRAPIVAGAAVEPSGRLLVLEQGGAPARTAKIFRVDLAGASDVLGRVAAGGARYEAYGADELAASYGIELAHKQRLFTLPAQARAGVAARGLALRGDGTLAVALPHSPVPGAGGPSAAREARLALVSFDEQNRFDASDRDGTVTLRHWPVLGGYMPDGIEALRVGGENYFVTANEGDTRDYDAKRLADVELDAAHFPDAAALQSSASLGRLKVSVFDGDLDGDGDLDEIHAFGARSVSIWDSAGNLVFDTGSLFEEVTALGQASTFNSNNDDNGTFDSRSDDKGPEPEGLDIAEIDGHPYAFVGLERVGGIVVLDLGNPRAARFVEYVNPRNFAGSAPRGSARDLGPEGLKFVPAAQSPTGRGLLLVANEVSGTTSAYDVNL